jgi:hypothetical protein
MLPEPNSTASTIGARTFEGKDARMDTVMELEIGPGLEPGSYVVHVLRSVGGGEPTQTIALDLDELVARRPLLEATVLSSSVSARRVMSDTEAAVQDVGRRLFESTFSGEVRSAYRTSVAVAAERGKGVQIALRLTAPGLAALPWETLFDAETGAYLCRKEPLVRHVPAPHSPAALAIEPPMRVLGMISSPRGLPALDVGGERERLEEALRPHLDSGRVELKWLDEVTWTGVHRKLLEEQWHVLHFVGHGTYDVETDEGVLAFVGRDGRADYVTASSLADLLDEAEPTPRLVVLNSCQSGAGGTTDLFSGTAAALAHSGIRAVAAMQFSISDTAAIEFARGFYTALAHGRGIDEAVRSGRIGILGMGRGTLEWVTPVLYLRGEDTQLFEVAPLSSAKSAPAPKPEITAHTEPKSTPTPTGPTSHAPDRGDVPAVSMPIIRPDGLAAGAAGAGGTAAASATTSQRPFVSTAPDVPPTREFGRPVPPTGAQRVSSAPPPSTPTPGSPQTPWRTAAASSTAAASTAPSPSPARDTVPSNRPASSHPPSAPGGPHRTTRRGGLWLVVGLIALLAIGGVLAALYVVDRGGDSSTMETADPTPPETPTSTDLPTLPPTLVTIQGAELEKWTGLDCVQGDAFILEATGGVTLEPGPARIFGPEGYIGPEIGYLPKYPAFNPGRLIVGLDTANVEEYSQFGEDGVAAYTCPFPGDLWLSINDSYTPDNEGSFDVKIWKNPPPG